MPKYLLIALFTLTFYFGHSQTLGNSVAHDTCLNKKFSIVFYIVLDSNYSVMTSTQQTLNAIVDTLNKTFNRICVSFASCSTVFIPNYPYNRWKKTQTDPHVTSNWYADKTINFYIVDSIKPEPSNPFPDFHGYAYPPPAALTFTAKDVIVLERFRTAPPAIPDFFPLFHAMGHFFGLAHTYEELNPVPPAVPGPDPQVTSQEFADGTNGAVHGDLIPDTEADPGPVAVDKDGKSNPYIRPLDNFMSFLNGCRYTQDQYNLMARIILTRRLYLH